MLKEKIQIIESRTPGGIDTHTDMVRYPSGQTP
uniref:Uncharacterized protein n=1 Tax=Moniliophthora roreri TaxID=221103 RepID=A0A0W0G0V6_MONRR